MLPQLIRENPKKFKMLFLVILAYLIVTACVSSTPGGTPPTDSPDAASTNIAQTLVAQMTQIAGEASPTPTLVATQPETVPTLTPLPTFTQVLPATPAPTWTPLPTFTPIPATPTPLPCNLAQFVSDVTIPDGTSFNPGAVFVKTWRLKNIGSCIWTTDYDLFFVNGDKMNGSTLVDLPKKVNPGETVDVSVELTAPSTAGAYLGNWQLRTGNGQTFGIGANGTSSFWVKINVVAVTAIPLNLLEDVCKATWTSGAGTLPCPGQTTDTNGFVQVLTSPVRENGKTSNDTALWVHPQFTDNGFVEGEYPDFKVLVGDKFVTHVGCLYTHTNCKVIFTLSYRDENGTIKTLGTWYEAYEGLDVAVSLDLSALAGKKVNFILRVDAWGGSTDDHAYWLNPNVVGVVRSESDPLNP